MTKEIITKYKTSLEAIIAESQSKIGDVEAQIKFHSHQSELAEEKKIMMKLELTAYEKCHEELTKIMAEHKDKLKEAPSSALEPPAPIIIEEEPFRIEVNDILTIAFDYPKNEFSTFRSLKKYISPDQKIAMQYGSTTYFSTIENIMKLPFPHKAWTFGKSWNNNNRTAVKLMREYLATTEHDPDHGMY